MVHLYVHYAVVTTLTLPQHAKTVIRTHQADLATPSPLDYSDVLNRLGAHDGEHSAALTTHRTMLIVCQAVYSVVWVSFYTKRCSHSPLTSSCTTTATSYRRLCSYRRYGDLGGGGGYERCALHSLCKFAFGPFSSLSPLKHIAQLIADDPTKLHCAVTSAPGANGLCIATADETLLGLHAGTHYTQRTMC